MAGKYWLRGKEPKGGKAFTLTEAQRTMVEATIADLAGKPLTGMFRYAGWQAFAFGDEVPTVTPRGEPATHSEYSLRVCCHWQIEAQDGFMLGFNHFGKRKRKDAHAQTFYHSLDSDPPFVTAVTVDKLGGMKIWFTKDITLTITPTYAGELPGSQWIFFPPESDPRGSLWLTEYEVYWVAP